MSPIGVAVIGVGKMGLSHLSILQALEDFTVRSVIDRGKLLRSVLKTVVPLTNDTADDVLSDPSIDAVVISTPTASHFHLAKSMLEAGKHVFLEKPLTRSASESWTLLEIAKSRNLVFQPGYVNTFNPLFQLAKDYVDQGAVGGVRRVESLMRGGVVIECSDSGWRTDAEAGGGALLDYGSHALDLLLYFFGNDVSLRRSDLISVFSANAEDVGYLSLNGPDGMTGVMQVDWSDPTARKAENTIIVTGTAGKLYVTKQEMRIFAKIANSDLGLTAGWNQKYVTDTDTDVPFYLRGEDFTRQLLEFARAIRAGNGTGLARTERACLVDSLIEQARKEQIV